MSSATTGDESSGQNSGGSRVNDKPDAVSTLKKKLKKVRVLVLCLHFYFLNRQNELDGNGNQLVTPPLEIQ